MGMKPVHDCIIVYGMCSSVKGRFDIFLLSVELPLSQSFAQGTLTKASSAAAGRILLRDLKPIPLFE